MHPYTKYSDPSLTYDSEYDIPVIPRVQGVTVERLIPWSSKNKDIHGTLHFWIDDYKFNSLVTYPKRYIRAVQKYPHIIQPDHSSYGNWNYNVQRYQQFLRQWVAAIWSYYGNITVIPNIHIPPNDDDKWKFYWAGLPTRSILAISAQNVSDKRGDPKNQQWFLHGFRTMVKLLDPIQVIYYGGQIRKLEDEFYPILVRFSRTTFIGQHQIPQRYEVGQQATPAWESTAFRNEELSWDKKPSQKQELLLLNEYSDEHTEVSRSNNDKHLQKLSQENESSKQQHKQELLPKSQLNKSEEKPMLLKNGLPDKLEPNLAWKSQMTSNELLELNTLVLKKRSIKNKSLVSNGNQKHNQESSGQPSHSPQLEKLHDIPNLNVPSNKLPSKLEPSQDKLNNSNQDTLESIEQLKSLEKLKNLSMPSLNNENESLQQLNDQEIVPLLKQNRLSDNMRNDSKQEKKHLELQNELSNKLDDGQDMLKEQHLRDHPEQISVNPLNELNNKNHKQQTLINLSNEHDEDEVQDFQANEKNLHLPTSQVISTETSDLVINEDHEIELAKYIEYIIFLNGTEHNYNTYRTLLDQGYSIHAAYINHEWLFPEVREWMKEHSDLEFELDVSLSETLCDRGWPSMRGGNKAWHLRILEMYVDKLLTRLGVTEILDFLPDVKQTYYRQRSRRKTSYCLPFMRQQVELEEYTYTFFDLPELRDTCEVHYLAPIKGFMYSSLRPKFELELLYTRYYIYTTQYQEYREPTPLETIWPTLLELDSTIQKKPSLFSGYSTLLDLTYEFEGKDLSRMVPETREYPTGRFITLEEKRRSTIQQAIDESNWLWSLNHKDRQTWYQVKPLGFSKSGKRVRVITIDGIKHEKFLPITNLYARPAENYFGKIL